MKKNLVAIVITACLISVTQPLYAEASPAATIAVTGHVEAKKVEEKYKKEIERLEEEHKKEIERIEKAADKRVEEAQAALEKAQQGQQGTIADMEAKYAALEKDYQRVCKELEELRRSTSTDSGTSASSDNAKIESNNYGSEKVKPNNGVAQNLGGSACLKSYSGEIIDAVDADMIFKAVFVLDADTIEACQQDDFDLEVSYPERLCKDEDGMISVGIKAADGSYYYASVGIHATESFRLIHGTSRASGATVHPTFLEDKLIINFYSGGSDAFAHRNYSGSVTGADFSYYFKYVTH